LAGINIFNRTKYCQKIASFKIQTDSTIKIKSMQTEAANVIIVAAYCSPKNIKWFSPGRQRKLAQVEALLTSIGLNCLKLSIAPNKSQQGSIQAVSLCNHSLPLIRFIQLFIRSLRIGKKIKSKEKTQWLWLYNTRMAEALVALALIIRKPSLKLFLQLEDLPAARRANAGIRGKIDGITSLLLSRRANEVSAVSTPVAEAFHRQTGFPLERIVMLPPLLDEAYQQQLAHRTSPFQNSYITIVYAGGYTYEKGVDELLSAFRMIESHQHRLLLLGPVPETLRAQLIDNQGVEVLGMVSNEKLFSVYAKADVVVNPHRTILNSDYIFPFKLIEILASGALPLTTAMPGLDLYDLPKECLFSGSQELADKLVSSYSIWTRNLHQLERLTTQVRQLHSMKHAQNALRERLITI